MLEITKLNSTFDGRPNVRVRRLSPGRAGYLGLKGFICIIHGRQKRNIEILYEPTLVFLLPNILVSKFHAENTVAILSGLHLEKRQVIGVNFSRTQKPIIKQNWKMVKDNEVEPLVGSNDWLGRSLERRNMREYKTREEAEQNTDLMLIWKCDQCKTEREDSPGWNEGGDCHCGGTFEKAGESWRA